MDRSAAGIARSIRLAREGQPDALNDLLEAYRNYVRILATTSLRRDVRAKADPSDLVQETFLKVHENFHQFRGTTEAEWTAWVRQILVRTLSNFHRSFAAPGRSVAKERPLESLVDRSSAVLRGLAAEPGPSTAAHRRELGVLVADALAELEPEDREVVVLRNLEELEWAEIAERTGRSPDAARMLWARALRRIAGQLGEQTP